MGVFSSVARAGGTSSGRKMGSMGGVDRQLRALHLPDGSSMTAERPQRFLPSYRVRRLGEVTLGPPGEREGGRGKGKGGKGGRGGLEGIDREEVEAQRARERRVGPPRPSTYLFLRHLYTFRLLFPPYLSSIHPPESNRGE